MEKHQHIFHSTSHQQRCCSCRHHRHRHPVLHSVIIIIPPLWNDRRINS
jgi:hypothetical protein